MLNYIDRDGKDFFVLKEYISKDIDIRNEIGDVKKVNIIKKRTFQRLNNGNLRYWYQVDIVGEDKTIERRFFIIQDTSQKYEVKPDDS
jgi:hypothetical protein